MKKTLKIIVYLTLTTSFMSFFITSASADETQNENIGYTRTVVGNVVHIHIDDICKLNPDDLTCSWLAPYWGVAMTPQQDSVLAIVPSEPVCVPASQTSADFTFDFSNINYWTQQDILCGGSVVCPPPLPVENPSINWIWVSKGNDLTDCRENHNDDYNFEGYQDPSAPILFTILTSTPTPHSGGSFISMPSDLTPMLTANVGGTFSDMLPIALIISGLILGIFILEWTINRFSNEKIRFLSDIGKDDELDDGLNHKLDDND